MEDLHRKLLVVGFNAGEDLGLVLAGGYALTEHGILQRPSRDSGSAPFSHSKTRWD